MPDTLLYHDDFNRADTSGGVLGGSWITTNTDICIQSNVAFTLKSLASAPKRISYIALNARNQKVVLITPPIIIGGSGPDIHIEFCCRFGTDKNGYYGSVWGGPQRFLDIFRVTDGNAGANLDTRTGDFVIPANASPTQYILTLTVADGPAAGQTTITFKVATLAAPNTIIAQTTGTDSTALLQRGGYGGFGSSTQPSGTAHGLADDISIYDTGSILPDGGIIAVGTIDGVHHNINSVASGTGGTPPLSYKWFRDRTIVFPIDGTTELVGVTTPSLNGSIVAPDKEAWKYLRQTRDSSNPIQTANASVISIARGYKPYSFVQIGDSITEAAGGEPAATVNLILPKLTAPRTVVLHRAAKAGAYLSEEVGRDPFYVFQPRLTASWYNQLPDGVAATIATFSCNAATLRLGTNDSGQTTAQHYGDELDLVIADLRARGVNLIILHSPPYAHFGVDQGASDRMVRLESYRSVLLSRVDNVNVFAGDFESWYYYADHPEELNGGVHLFTPSDLSYFEARAIERVFNTLDNGTQQSSGGASPFNGLINSRI